MPLALISAERVTNLYDLMDAAYDSPIIDINPRRNLELKSKKETENKKSNLLNFKSAE